MRKGLFIVFEGIDGAGKTTQVDRLTQVLSAQGFSVVVTRDPGGTLLGDTLRDLLLGHSSVINPKAEALLYAAARSQLLVEKVIPALERGAVVISDRFADSMYAYQGAGRGIDQEFLDNLNKGVCEGLVPDLTVLLDITPEKAADRINRPKDRMEKEGQHFLQLVRQGYINRAVSNPTGYLVLDASLPPEQIFESILSAIEKLIDALRHTTGAGG